MPKTFCTCFWDREQASLSLSKYQQEKPDPEDNSLCPNRNKNELRVSDHGGCQDSQQLDEGIGK